MIERNQIKRLLRLTPRQESEELRHKQAILLLVSQGTEEGTPGITTISLPSQEPIRTHDQLQNARALIGVFVRRSGMLGMKRTPYLASIVEDGHSYQEYRSRAMKFTGYMFSQDGDEAQIRDQNMEFLERQGLPVLVMGFWADPVNPASTVTTLTFPGGFSPSYARDKLIEAVRGTHRNH